MKKLHYAVGSTFAVLLVMAAAPSALAYRGDPSTEGPNYSPERHTAMQAAFETGDYDAWKDLMNGRGRVIQVVNAENFSRFAQAHELLEDGDLEGAKAVRAELGLGLMDGNGNGQYRNGERGQRRGNGLKDGTGNGPRNGTGNGPRNGTGNGYR